LLEKSLNYRLLKSHPKNSIRPSENASLVDKTHIAERFAGSIISEIPEKILTTNSPGSPCGEVGR
jgi:hypothetical protein